MGQHVHRLTLTGAALAAALGCRRAPEPAAAPPAPVTAAAVAPRAPAQPDPVDRLRQEQAGIPLPSGDEVWGVSIPTGCTPEEGWADGFAFGCRPTVEDMERYYRFRFPAMMVSDEGNGIVVRPDPDDRGYARVQRVRRGGNHSRLLIFRHLAPADAAADRLLTQLHPARANAPRNHSETDLP